MESGDNTQGARAVRQRARDGAGKQEQIKAVPDRAVRGEEEKQTGREKKARGVARVDHGPDRRGRRETVRLNWATHRQTCKAS